MLDWQSEINGRLARYEGYEAEWTDSGLTILCANRDSFPVSIEQQGREFQVSFSGWHEHFPERSGALDCFAFGLSRSCRLKVTRRGNLECAWTVQSLCEGAWTDVSTTGLMLFPFWKSSSVSFQQNQLTLKEH